jgi:hypothetical protein
MRILMAMTVLFGLAVAQDSSIPTDVSAWFGSTASLAAVVAALVALLRKHVLRSLDGWLVLVLSLALGVGLAFVGKLMGYLGANWLVFGLSAGIMASGGVDLLRGILGAGNAKASSSDVDASRARLQR